MAENSEILKSFASCEASTSEIPYLRHSLGIVGISFSPAARCASSNTNGYILTVHRLKRSVLAGLAEENPQVAVAPGTSASEVFNHGLSFSLPPNKPST